MQFHLASRSRCGRTGGDGENDENDRGESARQSHLMMREPGARSCPSAERLLNHRPRHHVVSSPAVKAARILSLLPIACLALLSCRTMGPRETGFLIRTVVVHGTTYPYSVYVPLGFDASKRWPVILFLHGAGER